MSKVGRNAPCPCGSGKKAKRCCGAKPQSHKARVAERMARMTPYQFARLRSEPKVRAQPGFEPQIATPQDLAGRSTEELVADLAKRGVEMSEATFQAQAEGMVSAWDVGQGWMKALGRPPEEKFVDEYFGLVACELWRRFVPDRACLEQIDGWVRAGFSIKNPEELSEQIKATDEWNKAWRGLDDVLPPGPLSLAEADDIVRPTPDLREWLAGYVVFLHNVVMHRPDLAPKGITLIDGMCERFGIDPYESFSKELGAIAPQLGAFYALGGDTDGAVKVYEEIIRRKPNSAEGYCYMAEMYSTAINTPRTADELRLAMETLDRALAAKVRDAKGWNLRGRRHNIESRLAKMEA